MLSLLPDISEEEMLFELHDRIYYNPLEGEYEIAEKFISAMWLPLRSVSDNIYWSIRRTQGRKPPCRH